jgi:hypothetical protein
MVKVTITADTAEELQQSINRYMIDYHPAGYGTRIVDTGVNDQGKHYANIKRYSSCD